MMITIAKILSKSTLLVNQTWHVKYCTTVPVSEANVSDSEISSLLWCFCTVLCQTVGPVLTTWITTWPPLVTWLRALGKSNCLEMLLDSCYSIKTSHTPRVAICAGNTSSKDWSVHPQTFTVCETLTVSQIKWMEELLPLYSTGWA